MEIVYGDTVTPLEPDATPDYHRNNPVSTLLSIIEEIRLAADREHYRLDSLQYLIPVKQFSFYGPGGMDREKPDPAIQDDKQDFQKQNVASFTCGDSVVLRGYVVANDWEGAFLKVTYRGAPDSYLSKACRHTLSDHIRVWIKIGEHDSVQTIKVPYVAATGRYELELWGYPAADLEHHLGERGRRALAQGEIVCRPDLVRGQHKDFEFGALGEHTVTESHPGHTMHPIRPLHIELAWCKHDESVWDSRDSRNYHFEFSMRYRGWNNFLRSGETPNPHGGTGSLGYRNLFSNYYALNTAHPNELGRDVNTWNFNAFASKTRFHSWEPFFAVDYMDLVDLPPQSAIGLHRHRDNQEVFFLIQGAGLMVVGDWCQMPERDRCLEIRTMTAGHLAMLRGGQMHAFINTADGDANLFVFGGYD